MLKTIEIEISFFIPLGISRDARWNISFMLHISVITSLQTDTYIDELVEIFLKVTNEKSANAFNNWDEFICCKIVKVHILETALAF